MKLSTFDKVFGNDDLIARIGRQLESVQDVCRLEQCIGREVRGLYTSYKHGRFPAIVRPELEALRTPATVDLRRRAKFSANGAPPLAGVFIPSHRLGSMPHGEQPEVPSTDEILRIILHDGLSRDRLRSMTDDRVHTLHERLSSDSWADLSLKKQVEQEVGERRLRALRLLCGESNETLERCQRLLQGDQTTLLPQLFQPKLHALFAAFTNVQTWCVAESLAPLHALAEESQRYWADFAWLERHEQPVQQSGVVAALLAHSAAALRALLDETMKAFPKLEASFGITILPPTPPRPARPRPTRPAGHRRNRVTAEVPRAAAPTAVPNVWLDPLRTP